MTRQIKNKKRGVISRRQKPVILIISEGKNVTETQYFRSFSSQKAEFVIRILKTGYATDPKTMAEKIEEYWINHELDESSGDAAFIILDLDCNGERLKQIKKAVKLCKHSGYIISNPCFEIWFLLHYQYSTRSFLSSNEVIKELRRLIPGYDKTMEIAPSIKKRTQEALKNAERLCQYHQANCTQWPSVECNPMTDVPIVFKKIKY